jgi:peptidoglycan/xylan/chitin deacetylase (PgdA/CDA1 family)
MLEPSVGITFHGIGAPARPLEAGEAPYWVSEVAFLEMLDRIARLPEPARIRITFDDGNASDHDIALPALLSRGLRARFFVLTGRINQPGSLAEGQIRALAAAGMRIGSHGIDHVNWADLRDDALLHELRQSKQTIEFLLGTPVVEASIPFGAWNGRVLAALRAAGYHAAWSSDRGFMTPSAFRRPRTSITCATGPDEMDAILSGRSTALSRLRRVLAIARKQWPRYRHRNL